MGQLLVTISMEVLMFYSIWLSAVFFSTCEFTLSLCKFTGTSCEFTGTAESHIGTVLSVIMTFVALCHL